MKAGTGLLMICLLGAMFLSLLPMSAGMDMVNGHDCPFMSHDEVFCPMTLADHISAWQSVFMVTLPAIITFVTAALAVLILAPNLLLPKHKPIPIRLRLRESLEKTYMFIYRAWQELFSNGILNPKLF